MGTESGVDATVTSNNKQAGRLTASGRSPQGQWQIVIVNWATGKKKIHRGVSVQKLRYVRERAVPQCLNLSAVK
jgi:hypothetical protein